MDLYELLKCHAQIKGNLSPRTIKKYHEVIRIFVQDTKITTTNISFNDVVKWRESLVNRVSVPTCNSYHRHMKALINTAIKIGASETNHFKDLPILKVTSLKFKTISDNDIYTLKAHINEKYKLSKWFYLAMIDFLYYTGMRRRQLVGLSWADIDTNKKTAYLNSTYSKNRNDNTIPINDTLIEHYKVLKNNLYQGDNQEQIFNITKINSNYKSSKMSPHHISKIFYNWSRKLNIEVSPHRFRHTFGTKVARNGGNLKSLQKMLGHSDIKTTMGYVEINIDDLVEIQKLID